MEKGRGSHVGTKGVAIGTRMKREVPGETKMAGNARSLGIWELWSKLLDTVPPYLVMEFFLTESPLSCLGHVGFNFCRNKTRQTNPEVGAGPVVP